jgi:hypothetical protein
LGGLRNGELLTYRTLFIRKARMSKAEVPNSTVEKLNQPGKKGTDAPVGTMREFLHRGNSRSTCYVYVAPAAGPASNAPQTESSGIHKA